ncbi:MAG: PspC domain-containing protein [Rubrobacteraceae bacterium]
MKRAKRDRWILGVCGGLARTYGWSPNLVRLLTVLLAIFIPGPNIVVIIAYVVAGIFLPETDEF